jgi:hypothetical protein
LRHSPEACGQPAPRPNSVPAGLLGSALFAVAFVAYATRLDWRGTIPRDRTSPAVGRDFLNIWIYGRAAFSADLGTRRDRR